MKKNIIVAIIAIVTIFGTFSISFAESNVSIPEPDYFEVSYIKDGKFTDIDLSAKNFGENLRISVDENTEISIVICRCIETGFNPTESVFTVVEDGKVSNVNYYTYNGNLWWHLSAGESGIAMINCGTEEDPNWVNFKIETVVE